MAWQEPKTDWVQNPKNPKSEDFNRIEGNIEFLKQDIETKKGEIVVALNSVGISASINDTHEQIANKIILAEKKGVVVTPGAVNKLIPAGIYHDEGYVAGDPELVAANIKSGVNIFGINGDSNVVDTSGGDAVASDIVKGKKAYAKGSLVTGSLELTGNATAAQVLDKQTFYSSDPKTKQTGTMPNRGAVNANISVEGGQYTIPVGYHNGSGKVTANYKGLYTSSDIKVLETILEDVRVNHKVYLSRVGIVGDKIYVFVFIDGVSQPATKYTYNLQGTLLSTETIGDFIYRNYRNHPMTAAIVNGHFVIRGHDLDAKTRLYRYNISGTLVSSNVNVTPLDEYFAWLFDNGASVMYSTSSGTMYIRFKNSAGTQIAYLNDSTERLYVSGVITSGSDEQLYFGRFRFNKTSNISLTDNIFLSSIILSLLP